MVEKRSTIVFQPHDAPAPAGAGQNAPPVYRLRGEIMSYAIFVAGSTIEYFSTFTLMLTLFRFQVRDRLGYLLFVAFLMSQVSYFTRLVPEIGDLSSFIQLALFVVLFRVLFRIPVYYSVIMNAAAFILGFVVQGMLVLAFGAAGVSLDVIRDSMWAVLLMQLLSSALFLIMSLLLYRHEIGFNFIPKENRDAVIVIKGTNAVLLAVIILIVSAGFVAAVLSRSRYEDYVLTSSAVFVLSLPFFIYYSIQKDREDAG